MRVSYSRSRQFKNVEHLRTTIDFGSTTIESPSKTNHFLSNGKPSAVCKLQLITRKRSYHKPTSIIPYDYSPKKEVSLVYIELAKAKTILTSCTRKMDGRKYLYKEANIKY